MKSFAPIAKNLLHAGSKTNPAESEITAVVGLIAKLAITSQASSHALATKKNESNLPMITKTTEQIEANIQEEMTSPFHALAQEMKVSNALKRQQIQATKDQNKLIAILVRVQEEGLGLNDNGWQYKNGNLASEIVSKYDS
jgi:methionine-rich copper-binding protein CopC